MDEPYLVKQAQAGDLDAFNRLVLAYQDLAFNLALRMLNDEAAAADATQAAFVSAYQHLSSFRGGSFRAWVMRMATNSCYDELRRRQRHPTTSLEPVTEEDGEEMDSPRWLADDNAPDPETSLERRQLEQAIQHCLDGLPEDFRAVIVMVDLEGLDYQEAAEAVHSPLGTIKSRVARARLRLRDCLSQFGELLPSFARQEGERER
jgi:RNA polymerase sigma-70 factor (ECF subfamily)